MKTVSATPKPAQSLPPWAKCCSHAVEIIASWEQMRLDTKDTIMTDEVRCAMCDSVWPAQKAARSIDVNEQHVSNPVYVSLALVDIS